MSMSDQRPDVVRLKSANATEDLQETSDHFVRHGGMTFAGTHLLLDLWGARHLDHAGFIEQTLRRAILAAGAELLHVHLHRFTAGGGISGVAVLAESHISVHTWPERAYAAFDIFMCGKARPVKAAQIIEERFQPARTTIHRHWRGIMEDD